MATIISIQKELLSPVPQDYKEAARYLGYHRLTEPDDTIQQLIKTCCSEMFAVISPKAVFDSFDLSVIGATVSGAENAMAIGDKAFGAENAMAMVDETSGAENAMGAGATVSGAENAMAAGTENSGASDKPLISFSDVSFRSSSLGVNLKNCSTVYLMAATIGPQVDALIRKTQILDSVKASIFQATGAMFIEKAVDYVNEEIKKMAATQNKSCKPRFSPGYGDVSLNLQKDFFRLLPCSKIGLSLMDTLIMAPEKSVTAFVGAY